MLYDFTRMKALPRRGDISITVGERSKPTDERYTFPYLSSPKGAYNTDVAPLRGAVEEMACFAHPRLPVYRPFGAWSKIV
jgi:hypothetical protein